MCAKIQKNQNFLSFRRKPKLLFFFKFTKNYIFEAVWVVGWLVLLFCFVLLTIKNTVCNTVANCSINAQFHKMKSCS